MCLTLWLPVSCQWRSSIFADKCPNNKREKIQLVQINGSQRSIKNCQTWPACLTCREVTDGKRVGDKNYCFFTQNRLWIKSVKLRDGKSQYLTPHPTVFISGVVVHGQNFPNAKNVCTFDPFLETAMWVTRSNLFVRHIWVKKWFWTLAAKWFCTSANTLSISSHWAQQ